MPKQGKVPYKDLVHVAINQLRTNIRHKITIEISKLYTVDEIVNNFYTEEEKVLLERVSDFIDVNEKEFNGASYYPECSVTGYFPKHKYPSTRILEVFLKKLKNSELICQLIDNLKSIHENLEADQRFLNSLDNKNYGENLFRYAPIVKSILGPSRLEKFSDKAKNTPPAPEAYQWKLNGISTALTYLELHKD